MSFIEVRQVSYSYPGKNSPALTDIDLSLEKEGITAVVGPNGSGKTTLTKLIMGILKASQGGIYLAGRSIEEFTLADIGRCIGYVFQNPDLLLFCSTVEDEIGFGLLNQGCASSRVKESVDFYLNYFELSAKRHAFPLHLSRGERQRLAIAAVLANEPDYLILDEPTTGLDAYRKNLLAEYLRKIECSGRGILLLSHDMTFVDRMAKRVIRMENGRIKAIYDRRGDSIHDA